MPRQLLSLIFALFFSTVTLAAAAGPAFAVSAENDAAVV